MIEGDLRGPGIVDQRIDSSPTLQSCIRHTPAISVIGDIRAHEQRFDPVLLALACGLSRLRFALRVIDDGTATAFRKVDGARRANAGR